MASVCFYFQVHQPYRLRRYSVFATDPFYFDNEANEKILRKVADKCYRPTTAKMLDLVRRHEGRFRIAYSISGVCIEQLKLWAPDVIDMFKALADTGACEFINETTHHSLSFLFSKQEFDEQVENHERLVRETFGVTPTVFRNTELIYSDELGHHIARKGKHRAVLCEGVDGLLGYRSPNYVYVPPRIDGQAEDVADRPVKLLLKNFRLSDDIAFRFSNRGWKEWPLTAEKFARWVNQINGDGYCCNLFMDYETFGEHQWADTGIFEFLDALPGWLYDTNPGNNDFLTPTQVLDTYPPVGEYKVSKFISWADTERDLSAWLGNPIQDNAAAELYRLEAPVRARHAAGDPYILEDWRKLTTSDHLYYMCTKYWADGDVHKYFSPYDSPYDAYINFMNVLDNLKGRAGAYAVGADQRYTMARMSTTITPIMTRADVAREIAAVSLLRGTFTLRSGKTSSYYLDKYLFSTQPRVLAALGHMFAERLPHGTVRLAGAELGGIPLVSAASIASGLPCLFVRNAKKDYGTAKQLEGKLEAGDRVTIVEDVATTGGQALEAAKVLRDAGANVLAIIATIDRLEGARENIEKEGIAFDALFTVRDLGVI